jgi:hypothetical protein
MIFRQNVRFRLGDDVQLNDGQITIKSMGPNLVGRIDDRFNVRFVTD